MNIKTVEPPSDEKVMLVDRTIKMRVDYRIAGAPEKELKRLFVCEEIVGGGLNILGYKEQC